MSNKPIIQLEAKDGHDAPWVPVGEPFPAPVSNEHLDRAIEEARKIVKVTSEEPGLSAPYGSIENSRTYARALIAHIVNHLAEDKPMSTQAAFGYGMALDDLREIAGIETEKVYEHNDGN